MRALLLAELLKLRTTRTFIALTGAAIFTSLLFTVLVGLLEEPATPDDALDSVFTSDTSSLFILLLAIIGITGEWRHRTITSSLLAAPDRLKFLAAKTIAFAVAGLVLSVLIAVAVTIVGFTILTARDLPTPEAGALLERYARNAMIAALLAALGVGIGAIVRNQIVAIVGVIIFSIIIEPVLLGLVPDVGKFGPLSALPTAAQGVDPNDVGLPEDTELVAAGAAVALMLAWIGAAFAAGAATLAKRDLE
jgi:ABC-type transport system involved in multi-copper enzyme maturation permease subunit